MGIFDGLLTMLSSDEELENAYEEERQRWMKTGFNGDGSHTKKMEKLNKEISKRSAKKWKKDPRRNTDPNFRWTDANRWDKD